MQGTEGEIQETRLRNNGKNGRSLSQYLHKIRIWVWIKGMQWLRNVNA